MKPWCYHSNKTSLAELLHSTTYLYNKKVQLSFEFIFGCPLFGVKGLTSSKDAFGIAYPSRDAHHVQVYLAMRLPCHLISSRQSLLQGSNGHLIPVWKRDSFSLIIYKCIWLTLLTVLICRLNNGAWRYPYSWEQFGKSPSVVCGGCEWNEASWGEHQVFFKQFLWMCSLCDKHTSSFLLSVNLFVLKIILPILPSIQTKRLSVVQFTLRHCHVSFCKWVICHVPFTQLYLDNS